MKKGENYNVKPISVENPDEDTHCQGLVCSRMGTEYVPMKVRGEDIKIWACEKCAKQMR
jgi:hypothetical protein